MSKLATTDIETLLRERFERDEDRSYDDPDADLLDLDYYDEYASGWEVWYDRTGEPIEVPGLGIVVAKYELPGGDDVDLIFTVPGGKLYAKRGYSSSYGGTEFDGPFREVRPVQKIVTVYEDV